MRRWLRWLIISFLAVMLILISGSLYLFYFGGMKRLVIGWINDALKDQHGLSVDIGRISGGVFSDLEVEDLSLDYEDTSTSGSIIIISRLSAQYPFSALWYQTFEFDRISIDGVELNVNRTDDGQLVLPLPGPSSASGGSKVSFDIGRLEIDNARIRIDRSDDTLWLDDLSLVASLKSEDNTLSIDLQHFGFASSDTAIALDKLAGKATYANGRLFLQDLLILNGKTRVKLSGVVDIAEQSGSAEFAVDCLDLTQVNALAGTKLSGIIDLNGAIVFDSSGMIGRASVGGEFLFASIDNLFIDFKFADKFLTIDTLYGTILTSCGIDGRAEIDFSEKPEQYRLSADIRNFDLKQLVKGSFDSDLNGRLELSGESFSNATLLLNLDIDLYESSFDEYPLQRASGPLCITTDSLSFPSTFEIDYFENRFHVMGQVNYGGNLQLEIDAALDNLDRYRERLFIDQPGGRGRASATLSGRTSDPDLTGWFASDSLWLYGLFADSCFSSFKIDRFLTGRKGEVEVHMMTGAAWRVPYDSGYSVISLDSQLAIIDTVLFSNQFASFTTRGQLDQGSYPWRLTLDTLSLSILERDFYNRSQMIVEIDTVGFDLINTIIGEATTSFKADNRINFDETMDLTVRASGIQIAPWLLLFDQEYNLDATASGEAVLDGIFAEPAFSLVGSLDSIVFRDLFLGNLSGSAYYDDRLVRIDSMVLLSDLGEYRTEGHFYADLSFANGIEERLPDLPFDLKISAMDTEFDLVTLFLPSVEHLAGDFYADFRLNGTPRKPHLDGQAYLKNGRLKYFDLVNPIRIDSATALMIDNKIKIDTVRVYVCDKKDENQRLGYADIWGVLTVKALDSLHYDIDINIPEETPFEYDLDDIKGVVQGRLKVLGDSPPAVTGDLILSEGKYQVEFADDETGSPLMLALSGENTWDLNINIEIPSNYRIRNEDIDAEFSGFLNIIREDGLYRFIGELEILRGKGYLFDKTFRIIPDSARVIFEDIEYPNPRLDIWARSRIPVSRSGDDERGYQDLKVHVTGTLDNPEFGFFLEEKDEDTPLSYEAIIPLIVANYYGSESAGGAFEERITQLVSSQVSQIATRRIGVETFEIDPTYEGYLDLARTRVTLGFYTSQNLYLWGRSEVGFGQRPRGRFRVPFQSRSPFGRLQRRK